MLARVTSGRKLAARALKDLDEHIIANALNEYFCPYNVGTLSVQAPQEKIAICLATTFSSVSLRGGQPTGRIAFATDLLICVEPYFLS
ncbi:MAG: hypothetical protein WA510_15720 [Acidobacteriaceae bacterium]